jgi:ABC-type nickel/cobalt efflux system permease component RcnA
VALTAALRVVLLLLRRPGGGYLAHGHLARHQREGGRALVLFLGVFVAFLVLRHVFVAFLGRYGVDADAELLLLRDQHVDHHADEADQQHRPRIRHSLHHTAQPEQKSQQWSSHCCLCCSSLWKNTKYAACMRHFHFALSIA